MDNKSGSQARHPFWSLTPEALASQANPSGKRLRDHNRNLCRESNGALTVNGTQLASGGRCAKCRCRLYSPQEIESGLCVDHGAHAKCAGCDERPGAHRLSEKGLCVKCWVKREAA